MPTAVLPIRHAKKRMALEALAHVGTVLAATAAAGVHRSTHYDWMRNDPEYAAAALEAEQAFADRMEAEATRRAVEGVPVGVYYEGKRVATETKYSDVLLIFKLKGARPEKYREGTQVVVDQSQHLHIDSNQAIRALLEGRRLLESGQDAPSEEGGR